MSDGLDYDPDTTGDFDETTLDGSEGLDGDFLTGDGENYVMDPPDRWRGASPHDTLGKRLAEEKPDIDVDDDLDDDPEMPRTVRVRQRWPARPGPQPSDGLDYLLKFSKFL